MKSDRELQQDVIEELAWDPRVNASQIGVIAEDGVVTLTGTVNQYGEKTNAECITKRVLGVKAIANEIEVKITGSAQISDSNIAQAAVAALRWHTSVPEDRVQVSVAKGWITLTGEVDWQYQRESSYEAVKDLLGVKGIVNSIYVRPSVKAGDIKYKIKAALHRSAEIDANQIDVDALDGRVTLHGTVKSHLEKDEAEKAAWMAPGVTQVENDIAVE